MRSRPPRMIRRAADDDPRMRIAVPDGWTAVRLARTIIQDRWMTFWTAVRVPGRAPAARVASWRAAR